MVLIIDVQNTYILWLGIALLVFALGACVYRLVRAALLSAGIDESQSRVVAIALITVSGAYAISKYWK